MTTNTPVLVRDCNRRRLKRHLQTRGSDILDFGFRLSNETKDPGGAYSATAEPISAMISPSNEKYFRVVVTAITVGLGVCIG